MGWWRLRSRTTASCATMSLIRPKIRSLLPCMIRLSYMSSSLLPSISHEQISFAFYIINLISLLQISLLQNHVSFPLYITNLSYIIRFLLPLCVSTHCMYVSICVYTCTFYNMWMVILHARATICGWLFYMHAHTHDSLLYVYVLLPISVTVTNKIYIRVPYVSDT